MGGYIGSRSVVLSTTAANVQDVTATDTTPEVTIINNTHEDTDGGREGKVIFKGQQSGGEESTLAEIQGSHDGTADDEKGDLIFRTNDGSDGASPTEAMRIDSDGKVGIGTSSPSFPLSVQANSDAQGLLILGRSSDDISEIAFRENDNSTALGELQYRQDHAIFRHRVGDLRFATGGTTERMRIDSSGNVLVGKDNTTLSNAGIAAFGAGLIEVTRSGSKTMTLNRLSSDGEIINIRKDGSTVGSIFSGHGGTQVGIGTNTTGITFNPSTRSMMPADPSSTSPQLDNTLDIGFSSVRWDDIYATNGTIQTSDQNEKQNIASLTSAEITAATAISKLFKTFKWKDKVAAKGDAARTHTGVIAQQVETAMSDAGLDAGNYAFFISTTWWETQTEVAAVEADEENGIEAADAYTRTDTYSTKDEAPSDATERIRLGVRYPELLAFIGAATEQRLTSIESRLAALEAG